VTKKLQKSSTLPLCGVGAMSTRQSKAKEVFDEGAKDGDALRLGSKCGYDSYVGGM